MKERGISPPESQSSRVSRAGGVCGFCQVASQIWPEAFSNRKTAAKAQAAKQDAKPSAKD